MTTCQHCKREITPPEPGTRRDFFDQGPDGSAWTWGKVDAAGFVAEGYGASCARCLERGKSRLRAALDDDDRNEWGDQ